MDTWAKKSPQTHKKKSVKILFCIHFSLSAAVETEDLKESQQSCWPFYFTFALYKYETKTRYFHHFWYSVFQLHWNAGVSQPWLVTDSHLLSPFLAWRICTNPPAVHQQCSARTSKVMLMLYQRSQQEATLVRGRESWDGSSDGWRK